MLSAGPSQPSQSNNQQQQQQQSTPPDEEASAAEAGQRSGAPPPNFPPPTATTGFPLRGDNPGGGPPYLHHQYALGHSSAVPPPSFLVGNLSSSPATEFSSGTGGSSSYYIPASASSYPIVNNNSRTTMPPNLAPDNTNNNHRQGGGAGPVGGPSAATTGNLYQAYSPTYMATGQPVAAAPHQHQHLGHLPGALMEGSPATMGIHHPQQHTPLSSSPAAYSHTTNTTMSTQFLPMGTGAAVVGPIPIMTAPGNASTRTALPANLYNTPTPWTLGSTDGELALQLALLSQQEAGGVSISGAAAASPPTSAAATTTPGATRGLGGSGGSVAREQGSASSASSPPKPGGRGGGATSMASGESVEGAQSNSAGGGPDPYDVPVTILRRKQSLYQDRLIQQASPSVESVLAASCEVMGFDIAEVWLRTGPKTHQLTNSHLRPTALEDTVRQDLVDVYYGEKSSERTHRLSPALCKRAKEAGDVVWVSAHTQQGADALRCSISNVRTAVAIPVCHEASNTNVTIIFFSIRRIIVRPTSVEFLVHMSLAAGVAAVNSLSEDGLLDRDRAAQALAASTGSGPGGVGSPSHDAMWAHNHQNHQHLSQSEHVGGAGGAVMRFQQPRLDRFSVTGAQLDLQWRQLRNVEYLTDGGNSWIHTAVFNGRPVVVKTLKPECQDVALAINEIEGELSVHSRLHHPNIVELLGAGTTSKGVRFVVLERLDGGTLTQRLGYDTRIRDRRRRFWRKKQFSYLDVLRIARSIAQAMAYCHEGAIPGSVVLHRDLKPDNIGFTLDGTVKILDFGLAKIVENASINSDEAYSMSGETGSLRYMAPEVADALPYNHFADVYSFGVILWELNAGKKPFDGLNRELFYERIVHGGERPPLHRKWPRELTSLMTECWDADMRNRPRFRDIVQRLDGMLNQEKGGTDAKKKILLPKLSGMIDRHSTWF